MRTSLKRMCARILSVCIVIVVMFAIGVDLTEGASLYSGAVDASNIRVDIIRYRNSWDGSLQEAAIRVPSSYKDSTPTPLVVFVHGMFSCRLLEPHKEFATNHPLANEADRRGWLFLVPELHGVNPVPIPGDPGDPAAHCGADTSQGYRPMGAVPAQHDIIDALNQSFATYNVDRSRVYIIQESAGGLVGFITAAKYPSYFAGIFSMSSPTDLRLWANDYLPAYIQMLKEIGGTPEQKPFEYQRRSPILFASNLINTPIIIMHGNQDKKVPLYHAENMYNAIINHNPEAPVDLIVFNGGHDGPVIPGDPNFWSPKDIYDWLSNQTIDSVKMGGIEENVFDIDDREIGPFESLTRSLSFGPGTPMFAGERIHYKSEELTVSINGTPPIRWSLKGRVFTNGRYYLTGSDVGCVPPEGITVVESQDNHLSFTIRQCKSSYLPVAMQKSQNGE